MATLEKDHGVTHQEIDRVTILEKQQAFQQQLTMDEKGNPTVAVDYSGAHKKTDPREIALVKKLDIWIMPM